MSGLDEFMIHNHPHPVRVMWTSDVQAYERMWFTCQDKTGDLLVVAGMGIYPNLGTAEAFAIVNVRGRHTTVRAHRKLGLNRMDMTVGPLSFELVEPFRAVADAPRREPVRHLPSTSRGSTPSDRCTGCSAAACSSGPGRSPGWPATTASAGSRGGSSALGERFELVPDGYQGTRDHHWGTRDGVGGPALWSGYQHPHSGEWVEFDEYGVWGDHILYNLGDQRRGSDTLRGRRHRLRFEPDTHLLVSGEVDLVFAYGRGEDDDLRAARQPDRLPQVRHVRGPERGDPRRRHLARDGGRGRGGDAARPTMPTIRRCGRGSAGSTSITPDSSAKARSPMESSSRTTPCATRWRASGLGGFSLLE